MDFDGFDWDDGNRDKCTKHGVSMSEIELLFQGRLRVGPDARHSSSEQRFRAIGLTAQRRAIFVVYAWRQGDGSRLLIRAISARYMHKQEIESYEKSFS